MFLERTMHAKPTVTIAVVIHIGKTLGGGPAELRKVLRDAGHTDPLWYEVKKSSKAPKAVRRAVKDGATLLFVWGGDGMVQQCVDALGGEDVALAILPAGTGNLLATSFEIPKDIPKAVEIGLNGARKKIDVGVMNGERFAVMAGSGFDAIMISNTSAVAKEVVGRLAYFESSLKAIRAKRVAMKIRIDGAAWFKGKASCVLVGNIGTVTGGLKVFDKAQPDDGVLEVAVVTARQMRQWLQVLSRVVAGHLDRSPLVKTTSGRKVVVELKRKRPYELDGGARRKSKRLNVRVEKRAITLCVPAGDRIANT
jgi:diacylglycerol kinase (ATP)